MATTGVNFCKLTNAALVGSTVQAAASMATLNGTSAAQLNAASNVDRADYLLSDLSVAGYAKNGAIRQTYSGTTPKNIDLTDLTSNAASYAGDTTFASFNTLVLYNDGAADVTFAPGGSNPASVGLAGTSPTLTIPAGKKVVLNYATAGVTVDSTHKIITITPTSGGSLILSVGGA